MYNNNIIKSLCLLYYIYKTLKYLKIKMKTYFTQNEIVSNKK